MSTVCNSIKTTGAIAFFLSNRGNEHRIYDFLLPIKCNHIA